MTKNQAKVKQNPKTELWMIENYSLSSSTLLSKNIGDILNNAQKLECLFERGYMINDNVNEAENEIQIT